MTGGKGSEGVPAWSGGGMVEQYSLELFGFGREVLVGMDMEESIF